jgi:flagellin-like protein
MREKRGLSTIIATVLLIMLTIVAISFLYAFIKPMVNDNLARAKECNDAKNKFRVNSDSGYTCKKELEGVTSVMFARSNNKDIEIKGILVSISNATDSKTFKIFDNLASEPAGVKMYNSSEILIMPKLGESKTYVFPIIGDRIEFALIMPDDDVCDSISVSIGKC